MRIDTRGTRLVGHQLSENLLDWKVCAFMLHPLNAIYVIGLILYPIHFYTTNCHRRSPFLEYSNYVRTLIELR